MLGGPRYAGVSRDDVPVPKCLVSAPHESHAASARCCCCGTEVAHAVVPGRAAAWQAEHPSPCCYCCSCSCSIACSGYHGPPECPCTPPSAPAHSPLPPLGPITRWDKFHQYPNDKRTVKTDTLEGCKNLCTGQDFNCTFIVWDRTNGDCYQKYSW
jgi:hypothetical protein